LGFLNWVFFGSVVVGGLLAQAGFVTFSWWSFGEASSLELGNAFLLFGVIFVFNLVLSGFVFVTLSGLVFFVLSPILLGFRALLWGVLLNGLSTSRFVAVLPTVVLEGEGYVFAGLAGLLLGLSWLKPEWAYRGEVLTRSQALKRALKDSVYVYVLVALFLVLGALVETLTITLST
jgi:hypothetical protein